MRGSRSAGAVGQAGRGFPQPHQVLCSVTKAALPALSIKRTRCEVNDSICQGPSTES